ncbi:heme binding protein [Scheffersomyces xylosifermentans]|uniref:heme binding protein n=1 Tax=Scheffersomyces xylosifermentans TaxID=1304137 RepID=UPI00315DD7E7
MSKVQTIGATTKLSQSEILPDKNDVGALANRINLETRSLHDKVDKMVTLKMALALRDGKIYRQGLQSFYHVFASIEKSLYAQFEDVDSEWTPMLKSVWKPEIARREKAEQDLLFYYDDRKEKFVNPIMPEQIAFANHILEGTKEKPYLLFAYLHVMYLALFAGGRIMRSSFAKATGLFPHKNGLKHEDIVKLGTNFFTFDVADENLLRMIYKRDYELVTRNGLTEEQKLEIIEESKYIFEQNAKCISELEAHNLSRLRNNWTYIAVSKGYYVALVILALLSLLYIRRLLQQFL